MSLLRRNAAGPPEFSAPCEVKLVAKKKTALMRPEGQAMFSEKLPPTV